MNLSVIVCTYNPKPDYFARTLAALRAQSLPTDQWELLVVDNKSQEPLAGRTDLSWHPHARVVREEKLGLTPARITGMKQSTGEILVFVDDDNVLAPDYLALALDVAATKPFLGSWSGQTRGVFDAPPPEWTRRYWGNLAIREFKTDVWSNLPRLADTMPCGAGLCIRRVVADRYVELHETGERTFQFDRTGDSLVSGGDNDLAACACDVGLGVGLIASLTLDHLMPPGRLTEDHLAKLAEGIQFSSVLLDVERGLPAPRANMMTRVLDALRVMRLSGPHRAIAKAVYRGRNRATALVTQQQR